MQCPLEVGAGFRDFGQSSTGLQWPTIFKWYCWIFNAYLQVMPDMTAGLTSSLKDGRSLMQRHKPTNHQDESLSSNLCQIVQREYTVPPKVFCHPE